MKLRGFVSSRHAMIELQKKKEKEILKQRKTDTKRKLKTSGMKKEQQKWSISG